jgi:hypothetical protein
LEDGVEGVKDNFDGGEFETVEKVVDGGEDGEGVGLFSFRGVSLGREMGHERKRERTGTIPAPSSNR